VIGSTWRRSHRAEYVCTRWRVRALRPSNAVKPADEPRVLRSRPAMRGRTRRARQRYLSAHEASKEDLLSLEHDGSIASRRAERARHCGTSIAEEGRDLGKFKSNLHSRVNAMRIVFWAALTLVLAACGSDDDKSSLFSLEVPPGSNNGGQDASGSNADAGIACGTRSCQMGEYCCDGKCGACAPIGMNCPATPCP
jgi:hypothetical protein